MTEKQKIPRYKIVKSEIGTRYEFFCDLSGAHVCTSEAIQGKNSEEELILAWEKYCRDKFNLCHKCGKWVSEVMYNPDVLTCVMCTPIEDYPDYCPECGTKTRDPSNFCHICGAKLLYGGGL